MKKWYIGYFYNGYLKQILKSFEVHKELYEVDVWYPYTQEIVVKDGIKTVMDIPVFSNYILLSFEERSMVWKDILRKTHIISFLKEAGSNIPEAIDENEIEHLHVLESYVKTRDYSNLIGRRVRIIDGPFENFVGRCKCIIKGRNKAKVYVEMFNLVEKLVEIGVEHLEKIE